jgi:hypothetical protein
LITRLACCKKREKKSMAKIPVGEKITKVVSGSIWKPFVCDYCKCKYFYKMSRKGTGEGASLLWLDNKGAASRAEETAIIDLEKKLLSEIDDVPCPNCGMYSKESVNRLKDKARKTTKNACIVVFSVVGVIAIGLFLFFPSIYIWIKISITFLLLSICSWGAIRNFTNLKQYNPNFNARERRNRPFSSEYPVLKMDEYYKLIKGDKN